MTCRECKYWIPQQKNIFKGECDRPNYGESLLTLGDEDVALHIPVLTHALFSCNQFEAKDDGA